MHLDSPESAKVAANIVIIGGGFAGLWSAFGAARKRHELGLEVSNTKVTLVNPTPFHVIRVRLYESNLNDVYIPLKNMLDLVDVDLVIGNVTEIDSCEQVVTLDENGCATTLRYDKLVFAAGSKLRRPDNVKGLENAFSIDTLGEAEKLQEHLEQLVSMEPFEGRDTVLVVGAGLTGLEVACEMPKRLRSILKGEMSFKVIIADHSDHIGSNMGFEASGFISKALNELGIESRVGVSVSSVDSDGAVLDSGERISAGTVIWTTGMRANDLTARLPVAKDRFGRVEVDEFLRVKNVSNIFAAGDVANLLVDGSHESVMSCQHARPMGRFAGHNVVAELVGQPLLPLSIPYYVTILDLGTWGALYTSGWERKVIASGDKAKAVKKEINCERIYPPTDSAQAIFEAASPVVQTRPALKSEK